MPILQHIGRYSIGTCLALAASQVVVGSASLAATEEGTPGDSRFSLAPAPTAPAAAPAAPGTPDEALYLAATGPRRPLMKQLDNWGWSEPLDKAGIEIYGFIQASYTVNFVDMQSDDPLGADPARHRIQGRMFDHHSNELALNRFDVFVQRSVNYTSGQWEYGGLFEMQYGVDAAMMHSNGLFDFDWFGYDSHADPGYQFDLTQLYVDVGMPVGNGLRLRAGKFSTIIGYESCDPTTRTTVQFYSRSWILTMGIPMYHTGVMATYNFTDQLTANLGITRGWDQSLEDNNDMIDLLASVNYEVNPQLTLFGGASFGPQNPDDEDNWRGLLNATAYFKPDPNGPWTFAVDSILGFEDNSVFSNGGFFQTGSPAGVVYDQVNDIADDVGDTYWFGIAGFAAYRINSQLSAKGRLEWFYDADGTRWRVPAANTSYQATVMNNPFVRVGRSYSAVSFTAGLDIVPFPTDAKDLLVRPEVRLDVANHNIFVNQDRSYQVTMALDVIYRF